MVYTSLGNWSRFGSLFPVYCIGEALVGMLMTILSHLFFVTKNALYFIIAIQVSVQDYGSVVRKCMPALGARSGPVSVIVPQRSTGSGYRTRAAPLHGYVIGLLLMSMLLNKQWHFNAPASAHQQYARAAACHCIMLPCMQPLAKRSSEHALRVAGMHLDWASRHTQHHRATVIAELHRSEPESIACPVLCSGHCPMWFRHCCCCHSSLWCSTPPPRWVRALTQSTPTSSGSAPHLLRNPGLQACHSSHP